MIAFYVAACDKQGGIYYCETDGTSVKVKQFVPLPNPMYMEISDDRLYVLTKDGQPGGLSSWLSFQVLSDGTLGEHSEPASTLGTVACHLTVANGKVYAANYVSGSIFCSPDRLVTHTGHGPNPARQSSPHIHCTVRTPDEKYICAADLGTDCLVFYNPDLTEKSRVIFPAGSGPRHLAFSPQGDCLYCVTELSNEVFALTYRDGTAQIKSKLSTLAPDFTGVNTAAAIRLCGDRLYVSNRGENSIAVFSVSQGLTFLERFPCGGDFPRDINIKDNLLICTNEKTNDVTFFDVTKPAGKLLPMRLSMPDPLNIIFVKDGEK